MYERENVDRVRRMHIADHNRLIHYEPMKQEKIRAETGAGIAIAAFMLLTALIGYIISKKNDYE